MCAMEMVAWLAGEQHSDGPNCTCPVLAGFVRAYNDSLPDDHARNYFLRPLIPLLVGTRGSAADEARRGYAIADAAARIFTPMALERAGKREDAQALRELPEVFDSTSALLAAQATAAYGDTAKATTWLLRRAALGMNPAQYAIAAVQAMRRAGTTEAMVQAADLLRHWIRLRADRPADATNPIIQ